MAPEEVISDGLKPSTASHSPCRALAYVCLLAGAYPLMTNDRKLTAAQVLEVHKGQPMIEKRFEQIKTVHEIAPVFLKDEGRIEALFTLYAIALLVQALIERELRQAMARQGIDKLTIYPDQRQPMVSSSATRPPTSSPATP